MSEQEMDASNAGESENHQQLKSPMTDFKLALMQTVRDFPVLYDHKACRSVSSHTSREHAWTSIAGLLDDYFNDNFTGLGKQAAFCKKTWEIVRGNFRRDLRENTAGKRKTAWWGRKHLTYLRPYYDYEHRRRQDTGKGWKNQDEEDSVEEDGNEGDEEVNFSTIPISGLPESESSTVSLSHYSPSKKSSTRHNRAPSHSKPSGALPVSPTTVEDEADLQVRVWLTKLRRLSPTDRRRAMKKMSDVLFEAEESVLLTESSPSVATFAMLQASSSE